MKFKIKSEIFVGCFTMKHTHIQEFADDSNVFDRVCEYRTYMHKTFPLYDYRIVEAKEIRR